MNAASYVGRVGGLAIALGIGAAMTTGVGVAWAETPGSESSDHATTTETTPAAKSPGRKRPLSKIAERVREGVVSSTGGALTSSKLKHKLADTLKEKAKVKSETKVDKPEIAEAGPEVTEAEVTEPDIIQPNPAGYAPANPESNSSRSTVRLSAEPVTQRKPAPRVHAQNLDLEETAEAAVNGTAEVAQRGTVALTAVREKFATQALADIDSVYSSVPELVVAKTLEPAEATAPRLVSGLLVAVGLAPFAAGGPIAPSQSPGLWALLAWARREYGRTVNPSRAEEVASVATAEPTAALLRVAPSADPNKLTAQPAAPIVGPTESNGWVTGGNITDQWYIGGTDLGIMWDNGLTGDKNYVLTIFGDTFDDQAMTMGWRNNVLLRSSDTDLSDGLQFDDAVISPGADYSRNQWWNPITGVDVPPDDRAGAAQVIRDPGFLGLFGSTTTIIPTAAISVTEKDVNGNPVLDQEGQPVVTQYVTVMSVRTWDTPGRWTTNWSAVAYSNDGGTTWTVDPNTVRSSGWLRSSTPYVPGNQNFQQNALVQGPEDDPTSYDENGTRYVYVYGTPSGRGGSAYLARVPEDQIRDLNAYEYWGGESQGWVADDPSVAVPVIGATDQDPPQSGFIGFITKAINDFLGGIVVGGLTGGNVGEMSVQYNEYLDEYLVLYTDGNNDVVMRVSESPQGEWSEPTTLVANAGVGQDTGMYAPMIHPWSGTDKLGEDNEHILYWNLSQWGDYNVRLMETDLSPMGPDADAAGTITV